MDHQVPPRARRRAAAAALLGLVAVGGLATVAVASGRADDVVQSGSALGATPAPVAGCVIADGAPRRLWVGEAAWDKVTDRVETALAARFGAESKTAGESAPLANGLVGRALDYATHSYVVVADPAKVDLAGLQADLRALAGDVTDVRVQAGCHSTDDLLEAERVLRARTWHPDAARATYDVHLDARTSTYQFTTLDAPVADALKARLGDLVEIHGGTVRKL